MKSNLGFRGWFYFRMGWSTYFVFVLAAINTLTVTYFLAIENYPALKSVFPSFEQYVVITMCVGIPLLIVIGYAHYKKTIAYKSEMDVLVESNPYLSRNTVNADLSLKLNLKLISLLLKMSTGEKIEKNELDEIEKLYRDISKLVGERSFKNNLDIDFIKKQIIKGYQ
jgi:hypothetical protein|tara:strand:+ start:407 stop:910 length:504 start_codon:yes stop_codon:yes gene_type:complete